MPSRIQIAKPDIIEYFDQSKQQVFWPGDIANILQTNRGGWRLTQNTTIATFLDFLTKKTKLTDVKFTSNTYRPITRYVWGASSPYQLALSLGRHAYLTHGTAVFLHGLNDQIPRTIYVNKEQSKKPAPNPSSITQESLSRAFSAPQRESNYLFTY